MQNRYFVMRHGESTANQQGIIVSDPTDALNNYGLTSMGADQVMHAAVKTRLRQDTLIVSSDYLRAAETAQIMHKILDVSSDIQYQPALRERSFGNWHLSSDQNYNHVWQNDLKNPHIMLNDVETIEEIRSRATSVIEQLESDHQYRTILLVGHGDVLQILLCHFNGIDLRFHRSLASIKNAEIRVLPQEVGELNRSA